MAEIGENLVCRRRKYKTRQFRLRPWGIVQAEKMVKGRGMLLVGSCFLLWISMKIVTECGGLVQRSYSLRYSSQRNRYLPWMAGTDMNDDSPSSNQQSSNVQSSSQSTDYLRPTGDSGYKPAKSSPPDPFGASGGIDFSPGTKSDPRQDDEQQPELIQTLRGGPALIFELARRSIMFVHDFDDTSVARPQTAQPAILEKKRSKVVPRWHPHDGISDANPAFRQKAPAMNNQGFAKSIWRNARKRNKPQLWKQALRTYDRMTVLEKDPDYGGKIQRTNTHHEGAMVAAAKLGHWRAALEIYHYVWQAEQEGIEQTASVTSSSPSMSVQSSSSTAGKARIKQNRVYVTDNMILSLVKACVRASRSRSKNKKGRKTSSPSSSETLDAEAALRRIPLDTAQQVLSTMQEEHSIPLVAYFVNPLAAAYQSLGYFQDARHVLQTMLSNRTVGEEEIEIGTNLLNVHDLFAKDKGSYGLMVTTELSVGDFGSAVQALQEMNNAGLFPDERQCRSWSEISERRPRGSQKKKRDDYWTDTIL